MESPPPLPCRTLSSEDLRDLAYAKSLLDHPGLTARIANVVGRPIERSLDLLPAGASDLIHKAAKGALTKALRVAVSTLGSTRGKSASEGFHKLLVGASGGIGGVFGMAALPIELPISTTIMLRSIADIARSEGHDLRETEIKLACLEVFAFGGRTTMDDAAESSYWAVRATLATAISEASRYVAEKGILEHTAPALLRLIAAIASRFGLIVSEQAAAKMVPIVGAAGGSIINVLFIDHFQDMARGHFIVKRLERKCGSEAVQRAYEALE
jgi:hypothetical protein